jgi:hypothetical protein
MLFDGTYFYQYDAAGNRTAKFQSDTGLLDSSATDITIFKWNEKNALTAVTTYDTYADHAAGTGGVESQFADDWRGREPVRLRRLR